MRPGNQSDRQGVQNQQKHITHWDTRLVCRLVVPCILCRRCHSRLRVQGLRCWFAGSCKVCVCVGQTRLILWKRAFEHVLLLYSQSLSCTAAVNMWGTPCKGCDSATHISMHTTKGNNALLDALYKSDSQLLPGTCGVIPTKNHQRQPLPFLTKMQGPLASKPPTCLLARPSRAAP